MYKGDLKYPKLMWVGDCKKLMRKRVVVGKVLNKYIACYEIESMEEFNKTDKNNIDLTAWKCARDIEEEKPITLTMEEIADKFNTTIDKINIVINK